MPLKRKQPATSFLTKAFVWMAVGGAAVLAASLVAHADEHAGWR